MHRSFLSLATPSKRPRSRHAILLPPNLVQIFRANSVCPVCVPTLFALPSDYINIIPLPCLLGDFPPPKGEKQATLLVLASIKPSFLPSFALSYTKGARKDRVRSLRSNNLNGTSRGLAFRGEEEVRAREFFHRDVTHGGSTATQLVLGWTNFQMCKKKKKKNASS